MLRGSNWERFFQIDSLADVRISFPSKFYENPSSDCLSVGGSPGSCVGRCDGKGRDHSPDKYLLFVQIKLIDWLYIQIPSTLVSHVSVTQPVLGKYSFNLPRQR